MLYIVSWNLDTSNRDAAVERFKETGGAPPEGVTMIGRWHAVAGLAGLAVAESDDPVAVAKWAQAWTDLLEFEITPVVDDAGFMEVVS